MYNFLLMDIGQPLHKLQKIILCLQLTDPFPLLDHLIQRMIIAQLHNDIHILCIFKDMIECDNIAM